MSARAVKHGTYQPERSRMIMPFMISGLCHLAVFVFLILSPSMSDSRPSMPPAIHVRMVALPAATVLELPTADTRPAVSTSRKRSTRKPPPKNAVSISTKKAAPGAVKTKTSLKRRTYKSDQAVERALDRIRKNAEENRPTEISAAIDRLREQVKDQPPPEIDSQEAVKNLSLQGTGPAENAKTLEIIDIYRVEIAFTIQKNWVYNPSLAGKSQDLMTEIAFNVLPNGKVDDIWFDKRSGNNYLDESAKKAIVKSALPPHPTGVVKPYITVGLRFTPQGIF